MAHCWKLQREMDVSYRLVNVRVMEMGRVMIKQCRLTAIILAGDCLVNVSICY